MRDIFVISFQYFNLFLFLFFSFFFPIFPLLKKPFSFMMWIFGWIARCFNYIFFYLDGIAVLLLLPCIFFLSILPLLHQIIYTKKKINFMGKQTPEPSTEIIGSPDVYIESGSTINLTCVIEDSPEPPAYIFWNHNNAVSIQSVQCSFCFCLHDVFIMMSKLLLMFVLFQWKNKATFQPINNLIHRFHSYTFVCLYLYRAICLCSYFSPVLHALTLKATLNHQSVYFSG